MAKKAATETASTKTTDTRFKSAMEQVDSLIRASVPIIYVVTHEENRFIEEFQAIASKPPLKRDVWVWSQYQGLLKNWDPTIVPVATGDEDKTWDPREALKRIEKQSTRTGSGGNVYIMRDFHKVLGEVVPRMMRDMYSHLIDTKKTIIIVSSYLGYGPGGAHRGLEPTLEKQVAVVDFELPNHEMILKEIKTIITDMKEVATKDPSKFKDVKLEYTDDEYFSFARALQGLTLHEVDNSIAVCMTHLRKLDVGKLLQEKKAVVRKFDILEYIDAPTSLNDVGGMDEAKKFFESYKDAFSEEAKKFGVEPLRGVLFTGVPGTGKSLLAKAISASWSLPLLRLDVGKVMTGLVGGSEQRMREAIALAKAVSPCILWIDEIEKALSGTKSSNFSDGGTLSRVFGTLLTAMQEEMDQITVIATANDISQLPPELIRRFNEVFFVDLPTDGERKDIFEIHLTKRGRKPDDFKMDDLIKKSEMYTGAEIEKAVKESIAYAWADGKRKVETKDIEKALQDTKPIAQLMPDKINKLREWARNRARYASSEAAKANKTKTVKASSGRPIDLDTDLNLGDIETPKEGNARRVKDIKQNGGGSASGRIEV